jgi:choline dehydrogenase-like flavoprotein
MSFHQMGSARMGRDPGESVVGETNEAHGTAGLFVMDGSCFPTASGVNPMLTIAAIAHRGATILAEKIG